MPIPREFTSQYETETDFVRGFLQPFLRKLGFAVVVEYHGTDEFGKDLVFAEVDRFGHVRYHAMQARFESSISQRSIGTLIEACEQAFAHPFVHPHTGQPETLSSFYAVNAGSISANARRLYFATLVPRYHQNARLLDGPSLLQLDRWAALARADRLFDRVRGLLHQLQMNDRVVEVIRERLLALTEGRGAAVPPYRLFTTAIEQYLAEPFVLTDPGLGGEYAVQAAKANQCLDALLLHRSTAARVELIDDLAASLRAVPEQSRRLQATLERFLETLSPLAGWDPAPHRP